MYSYLSAEVYVETCFIPRSGLCLNFGKTFLLCSKQQMTDKFKECDADNSGLVSLDEAKKVLRHPPFNFPDEKVSYTFR